MSDYVTKKPTGLQVVRNGNDFTFSWKIRDTDHGKKQEFQYKTSAKGDWTSKTVTAKQTSVTITKTAANISKLSFRVRGQRKKFSEKTTDPNTGKSKSTEVNPKMSDWATKDKAWVPEKPTKPTVSYTRTGANSGTFTIEHTADTTGEKIVKDVEYQTVASVSCDNPPKTGWSASSTVSGASNVSKTVTYTEQTETITATGLVRWLRARCVGPGGTTDWVYAKHAYSTPNAPALKDASASTDTNRSKTSLQAQWDTSSNLLKPVDEEIMQYVFAIPSNIYCNAPSSGWVDAMTVKPSGKKDIVTASVSDMIGSEQCMWIRIKAVHDDSYTSYSAVKRVMTSPLLAPGINANPNFSTGDVSVTLTINTQCSVAKHCIFYRDPNNPKYNYNVAILNPGVTTTTVTIPAIKGASKSCIGAYAFVGEVSGLSVGAYVVSPDAVDEDIAPVQPDPLVATKCDNTSVFLKLSWKWSGAKDMEIAWSDNQYAWTSNVGPQSCTVTEVGTATWLIQGLEVGKKWYFRGRYHGMIDTDEATSAWSNMTSIDLATNPEKPTLTLNRGFVLPSRSVSASWNYVNEDGSPQDSAQICLCTVSGSTVTYGAVIAHADSAQNVMVNYGFVAHTQYFLSCRVRAKSGRYSDWSEPIGLYCPSKPTLSFSNTAIVDGVMTSLSGTVGVTISTDATTGDFSLSITRALDYHVDRPDDGVYDGYQGEAVWTQQSFHGGADSTYSFTITKDDLIGELDDGAVYNLVASITDGYGQTVTKSTVFTINWTHKASIATPTVQAEKKLMAMRITPTQPTGYVSGDTFDIYRITTDQPELIVRDGAYGTTYVDPYPAFGPLCGHRVVAKTSTGSYITEDDTLAWYDLGFQDGDVIECNSMVIDCNGMQIILPFNLELTNKWQKDFKRTSYLGGAVQGDWNPAVLRDLSARTVIVKNRDTGELMDLRDLAAYAGPAHIRTPDGSSFSCDIQVTEDASYSDKKVKYSLSVKGIDPEEPDGLTLEEWLALHPAE